MKEIEYINFKNGVDYLFKHQILLFIFLFLEFLTVFIKVLDTSIFFLSYIDENLNASNILNYISPNYYIHTYINEHFAANKTLGPSLLILAITIIYFLPHVYFNTNPSFGCKLFKQLIINLQDVFLGKILFITFIDPYLYLLFRFSFLYSNILYCLISLFILIIIILVNWNRMHVLCVLPTKLINYPINELIQVTDYYLLVYKIILSISQNLDDVYTMKASEHSSVCFFFHFLISIYAVTGYVCCLVYFRKAAPFTIMVIAQLRFRIFCMSILVFVNIFLICFYRKNINLILFHFGVFGVIAFSMYVSFLFNPISIGMNNITNVETHLQLLFISNILESGKSKFYFEIYNERVKKHLLFCGKCLLCKGIIEEQNENEITTFEVYQRIFLRILIKQKKIEEKGNKPLNFIFDFLILLSEINSFPQLNYLLHLKFKRLLFKYKTSNTYIYHNLRYIYECLCNKIKQQENKEQKHFLLFYNINMKLRLTIEKLLEFIEHPYVIITPKDILLLSDHFENIADKKHKQLNERDKMQNYPLVLMRIVYEELLNLPLSKFEGSLRESENYNEEFLNQHFNEDKTMIISLNSNKKIFLIERIGHNLHWYLRKEFCEMFPKDFKQYAMKLFFDIVGSSKSPKKQFTFIVNKSILQEVPNYETFSYSFYVSPALKEDDFLIFGEYTVGSRGLLITVQFHPSEELIYWITDELSTDISLNDYLLSKNILKNKEPKILSKNTKFNLFNFMNKMSKRKLSFSGQKKYIFKFFLEFSTNGALYKIFFVKPKRLLKERVLPFYPGNSFFQNSITKYQEHFNVNVNNNNSSSSSNESNDDAIADNTSDIIDKVKEQYKYYKKKTVICVDDSSSVQTTSTGSIIQQKVFPSSQLIFGSNHSRQPLIIYNKRFVYTKCLMVLCSSIMIVFNIISLVIEISQNAKTRELNSIYTNLRSANRLFYTLISAIFSVICIGDVNGNNCTSYYQVNSVNEMLSDNITINLYEFILYENEYTINEFRDRVKVLKKNIYSLKDQTITKAFNQEFSYKKISIDKLNLTIVTQNTTFSNGLDILINSVYSILNQDNYNEMPIYLFSIYPSFNFSYLKNVDTLTTAQTEYYNCFLNYVSYLMTWQNIHTIMSNIILKHLKRFYRTSFIFMIVSFLFHIILGCLLIFYLYSFLCIFMLNIEKIMSSIKDEKCIEYFKKKFSILKSFCNLYETNPLTLIKNLDDMDWQETVNSQKIKKTKSKIFSHSHSLSTISLLPKNNFNSKHNKRFYSWKSYYSLLSAFFRYVFCITIYYLINFIIFSIFWTNQINNSQIILSSIESISIAESNGFNVLSFALMMIITNQTHYYIKEDQQGNETLQSTLLNSLKLLYDFDKNNKKLIKSVNDYFELNCDNFYIKINDTKIFQVSKHYPQDELIKGLIHYCKVNRYFEFNDEKIFIQGVYYSLIQFLNTIKQDTSYEGYLHQMKSRTLMKLLNKVFIVFRPLRTWINEKVYQEGLHNSLMNLTIIFVFYLVVNNLTDILLLLLIYFLFIIQIQRINEKINLMLSVMTVKENNKPYRIT